MTGMELAARVTAASAALGDFRRERAAYLAGGRIPDYPSWVLRLADHLGLVLDQLGGEAMAAGPEAGRLAAILAVVQDTLASETASRQPALERVGRMVAAGPDDDLNGGDGQEPDDDQEPFCTTCGEWAGMFAGMAGWHHYRGELAPGGQRELFDAGHQAVIGWTVPPGRALSLAGLAVVLDALSVATEYRRYRASLPCAYCDASPAELCEAHAADLDQAGEYDGLAARIGGAR